MRKMNALVAKFARYDAGNLASGKVGVDLDFGTSRN